VSSAAADGYNVDYLRVPVTDEKAPKDNDFEELIQRLWSVPDDAGVVFNCQVGHVCWVARDNVISLSM